MIITFYQFAKKPHSTAQPSGGGTNIECVLKTDSSIMTPTVQLQTETRPAYTYAYIAEYGRYYYITEWTYTRHALWEGSLSVDVLASYKSAIGSYNGYVLRSSALFDGSIRDDMYPMPASWTKTVNTYGSIWTHAEVAVNIDIDRDGCFILGISSASGSAYNKYGSIGYYAFSRANLQVLIQALLQNLVSTDSGFLLADASLALQKAIVDPLSYIKSVMWVPYPYDNFTESEVTGLDINGWNLTTITYKPVTSLYTAVIQRIPIPKHASTSARGSWLNAAPYTRHVLHVQPWGMINLDTSLLIDETQLAINPMIDFITGVGTLEIRADTSKAELAFIKTQVGVPVQISQVTQNLISGLLNTASSVANAVTNPSPLSVIGAIGSAIDAMLPHPSTTGGAGSFADLCGSMTLYSYFADILPDDNAHVGRPLCQNKTLSTIPGYIKCMDGDISVSALDAEREEIKRELEGGFFYE